MKIKISTDSTADIPRSLQEELNIAVLPLTIALGDKEWQDGVTLSTEACYKLLEESPELPTSSAVTPGAYLTFYETVWREGYTDLIHTALNSKGSSTWQNAVLARKQFFETFPEAAEALRIHILDSLTYSMGYGMAVVQAARMARRGETPEAIIAAMRDWLEHVVPTCIPLDLKCVKRSGRVTPAAAFLGEAMGIRPIIQFAGGEAHIISKGRGEKKSMEELMRICKAQWEPGTPYVLIFGNDEAANEAFRKLAAETLGQEAEFSCPVGCIIAMNIGPHMVGIGYRK